MAIHRVSGKTMKKSTKTVNVRVLGLLLISLQGCAVIPDKTGAPNIEPGTVYDTIIEHTIESGDRLVDLSNQYTGDNNQWSAIAAYNDITDPRQLKIGDIVAIPYSLIPEALRTEELRLSTRAFGENATRKDVAGNPSAPAALPVSPTSTLALKRQAAPAASSDVIVQSVTTNKSFELKPVDEAELRLTGSTSSEAAKVRVMGTYYPKGIYQQPASYSTLLMRVAPGTVFELEREVNDWYKVVTADGIGYLRAVDGSIEFPD